MLLVVAWYELGLQFFAGIIMLAISTICTFSDPGFIPQVRDIEVFSICVHDACILTGRHRPMFEL